MTTHKWVLIVSHTLLPNYDLITVGCWYKHFFFFSQSKLYVPQISSFTLTSFMQQWPIWHMVLSSSLWDTAAQEHCHTDPSSLLFILGKTDTNTEITQPALSMHEFRLPISFRKFIFLFYSDGLKAMLKQGVLLQ